MPTPAELLVQSLLKLKTAKRFSGDNNSYKKDNPNEYAKVLAYLNGGARPSGVTTDMGVHAVEEEDARRALSPSPPPPPPSGLTINQNIQEGQDLSGSVTWAATANNASLVDEVQFWIDGQLRHTEQTAPYNYLSGLDTNSLPNGDHVFEVRAVPLSGTTVVSKVTAQVVNTAPPPPPPPPPGGTALDVLGSPMDAVFRPDWTAPPQEGASRGTGGIYRLNPGLKMIVTDDMPTPWDGSAKAILTHFPSTRPSNGKVERYDMEMFFPSQTFPQHWVAGVLFEFHTNVSSGHHIALNSNGTFRCGRQSGPAQIYEYWNGPSVAFNRWIPAVMEIRWSTGGDGYVKFTIDGNLVASKAGQTLFDSGAPYLQYGFYSFRQQRSEVHYRNVIRQDVPTTRALLALDEFEEVGEIVEPPSDGSYEEWIEIEQKRAEYLQGR